MDRSRTVIQNITTDPGVIWTWGSVNAVKQDGLADEVVDTMSMNTSEGLLTVANCAISAIREEYFTTPSGQQYSPRVGILGLGSPSGNISFEDVTGQSFPGYLAAQNVIPSNSFSLHYGSATFGLGASLVWGGYDQSRVIGDFVTLPLSPPTTLILPSLLDIQIGVEEGTSPFEADSYTGLLQLNQSVFKSAVINPLLPYFFMSPETCANIAKHLPVTLQPNIGLYTWNTGDPQYGRIVNSPAYLALVFQSGSLPSSGNVTIKIPFRLLNLTLEAPIVSTRQQYFPCQPFQARDGSGLYYLGRAFLQAAFLSVNWERSTYFLGQAPGPAAGAPNIRPIGPDDTTILSDPASNFALTWSKHWTPLVASNHTTPGQNISSSSTPDTVTRDHQLLSKGAIAGLCVAVVLLLVAFGLCSWRFVYRRRCRLMMVPDMRQLDNQDAKTTKYRAGEGNGVRYEVPTGVGNEVSHEMPAGGDKDLSHEVPADREVHEI
ncbi:MAG: hypothetical protein Q9163_004827 [Psora crenata]